ncbi:phosphonate C-P lyase system protein PhnG [Tritonibacter multivorans]|nr:phosphonate C-P lyase system protein PhnG [Tritonibacter multivorans]MDA7419633.1 phosphonate C-P lyase system protein PhnG [Tritonibacter multivorans]
MKEIAQEARRDWMSLLARSTAADLARLWAEAGLAPAFDWLRRPEVGGVMMRGRQGGTGAPFNLGEITVTRCALKLADGTVGHGYVQGRDKRHAEQAALVDALMQTGQVPAIEAAVLAPLRRAQAARQSKRAAKAAATKVEFFTLQRGED